MKKVLFLCTGNSCRSQMAEVIVNAHLNNHWKAFSAGTRPVNYVHPLVEQVLTEIGISHQGYSKHVDQVRNMEFELVITLCDNAEDECPIWLSGGEQIHLPFPDPASVKGSPEELITAFRQVRDNIKQKVLSLLQDYQNKL